VNSALRNENNWSMDQEPILPAYPQRNSKRSKLCPIRLQEERCIASGSTRTSYMPFLPGRHVVSKLSSGIRPLYLFLPVKRMLGSILQTPYQFTSLYVRASSILSLFYVRKPGTVCFVRLRRPRSIGGGAR
jgi:hypothetical protein